MECRYKSARPTVYTHKIYYSTLYITGYLPWTCLSNIFYTCLYVKLFIHLFCGIKKTMQVLTYFSVPNVLAQSIFLDVEILNWNCIDFFFKWIFHGLFLLPSPSNSMFCLLFLRKLFENDRVSGLIRVNNHVIDR